MRHIFILIISIFTFTLKAQEPPKFLQDKLDFCNSNLSDEQTIQLRKELIELEDYFIKKGLLVDRSGSSYRAVYKQIAKDNDLIIESDTTFELLDTLEFDVYTSCSFKVLTPEQLSQLTYRHQEASERITAPYEGKVTPGIIAQRIVDNLTAKDFELEFFKVSALMSFYKISTSKLSLALPDFSNSNKSDITTIEVFLTNEDEIQIYDNNYPVNEAKIKILDFLSSETTNRGIELTASRGASYESYLELTQMFDDIYDELRLKHPDLPKNIFINEPK